MRPKTLWQGNANDHTINPLIEAARACGVREADWDFEWGDGGRVTFYFAAEDLLTQFRSPLFLAGISN